MADALLTTIRATLPEELREWITEFLNDLENGNYRTFLSNLSTQRIVGLEHDEGLEGITSEENTDWCDFVFRRLNIVLQTRYHNLPLDLSKRYKQYFFFFVAIAALQLFVQVSVTGPPLAYTTASLLLPPEIARDGKKLQAFRERLITSRAVDGISAYRLAPCPELLCMADTILASPTIKKNVVAVPWGLMRTAMMHQRLMSETSSVLQEQIYQCAEQTKTLLSLLDTDMQREIVPQAHLELAAIDLYYGFDKQGRVRLQDAQQYTGLTYALTGQLGKRTKYQERETSQLLVLAKSQDSNNTPCASQVNGSTKAPAQVALEDDTLLESVSYRESHSPIGKVGPVGETDVPGSLAALDPNNQPQLQPLDSVLLLLLASSITSAAPVDGLTREETLPYALRVLDGGSSNWQIYTQALLVRSRIEGYKSRTAERGLLQLQALVDQIIADTESKASTKDDKSGRDRIKHAYEQSTFLPRPKTSESASASERLRYVYLLDAPTRWQLEVELAQRWTSMGGLRSALEIYERLEMWPEAALCWAATNREDKARRIIKRQLNHSILGADDKVEDEDDETWDGPPRSPPPVDAPRLYCILGDIDQDSTMWLKAWDISNGRYARAQRSLGRYLLAKRDPEKAAEAYAKSLKVNQLNGQSWFAYGCCLLELSRFQDAVEAFARTVQLDDQDAEAWSNLAAALVKRGPRETQYQSSKATTDAQPPSNNDIGESEVPKRNGPQQHLRDALRAFKRAATLKQDSARIYENVLTVAASLSPPAYSDIIAAQRRIIELRGKSDGESCVDEDIVEALVRHVVSIYPALSSDSPNSDVSIEDGDQAALEASHRPGSVPALTNSLMTQHIQPLITHSSRLWLTLATLAIWRNRPASALEAHEKAWRISTSDFQWDKDGDEKQWKDVVQSTLDLCDAYESLGPKERTEGLSAGSGEVVAKDWKFKARSAVRGVLGRAKDLLEGSDGWTRLQEHLDGLKG